MGREILDKAARIKLLIFDVDGVWTDGRLLTTSGGSAARSFDVKDGSGVRMLLTHAIELAVISARHSEIVAARMAELNVHHVFQGCADKAAVLDALLVMFEIEEAQVAYVGDDLIDLAVMARVGLAIAPADAHHRVKQQADWVTAARGGRGAVRQVCDLLIAAKPKATRTERLLVL